MEDRRVGKMVAKPTKSLEAIQQSKTQKLRNVIGKANLNFDFDSEVDTEKFGRSTNLTVREPDPSPRQATPSQETSCSWSRRTF